MRAASSEPKLVPFVKLSYIQYSTATLKESHFIVAPALAVTGSLKKDELTVEEEAAAARKAKAAAKRRRAKERKKEQKAEQQKSVEREQKKEMLA